MGDFLSNTALVWPVQGGWAEGACLDIRDVLGGTIGASGADPTGATDSTAAIQAAIDTAATGSASSYLRGGATVVLPPGDFLVSGLVLEPGVSLVGAGRKSTRLVCATPGATILSQSAAGGLEYKSSLIRGILFDGGGTANNFGSTRIADAGIDLNNMLGVTVEDCIFNRFAGPCFKTTGMTLAVSFDRCLFEQSGYGGNLTDASSTTITFNRCRFADNDVGLNITGQTPVALNDTIIEKNVGVGLAISGINSVVLVNGGYIEENAVGASKQNVNIASASLVQFAGTYFHYITPGADYAHITIDGGLLRLLGVTFNAQPGATGWNVTGTLGAAGAITDVGSRHANGGPTVAFGGATAAARYSAQADSVAADVATLKADFNALLAKLRTAGVLAP